MNPPPGKALSAFGNQYWIAMSTTEPNGTTENEQERLTDHYEMQYPRGAIHGNGYTFDLDDQHKPAPENVPEHRNIDDGSLYQTLRNYFYKNKDRRGEGIETDHHIVVDNDVRSPWTDSQIALVFRSSNWVAGTGDGTHWEYHLTLKQVGHDGTVRDKTPVHSLNINVVGHYQGLTYEDGNEYPFQNEGSHVMIQSTWDDSPEDHVERAKIVIEDAFDYDFDTDDIIPSSHTAANVEAHHRIHEDKSRDAVYTINQTKALLPYKDGSVDVLEEAKATEGRWNKVGFTSTDWGLLFENLNVLDGYKVGIKQYYPHDPDSSQGAFAHPKVEVWLEGRGEHDSLPSLSRYEEIEEDLQTILNAHMSWAGVNRAHLVEDPQYGGASNEEITVYVPTQRRTELANYYEDLDCQIAAEAQRPQTMLPYDIMLCVYQQNGVATYEDLKEYTGAAQRTLSRHVRRLAEVNGPDKPGILIRSQHGRMHIMVPDMLLDQMESVLNRVHTEDTPEDRKQRAAERHDKREQRARRPQNQSEPERQDDEWVEEMAPDSDSAAADPAEWERLSELPATRDVLDDLEDDHIQVDVRADAYVDFALDNPLE